MPTPSEVSERALFLSPEPPYPLTGGGAMRSGSLLHYLARCHPVHLLTFRQPGSPEPAQSLPAGLADTLTVIDLPYHRKGVSARLHRNAVRLLRGVLPLTDRFGHEFIRQQVRRAVEGKRYGLAVIEHFWCAPYLTMLRNRADRVILDLHNIESVLHDGCASSEPWPRSAAHRRFAGLARAMEQEWVGQFDLVLVPSIADRTTSARPGAFSARRDIPQRHPSEGATVAPGGKRYRLFGKLGVSPQPDGCEVLQDPHLAGLTPQGARSTVALDRKERRGYS